VVSVGRLDLLAEARAAQRLVPCLDADELLKLATLEGARAIGVDSATGSLRRGKWADCTVIRTPSEQGKTPAELVLASRPSDVLRTYLGGREVFRAL
jgi:5-methylthioadenosine/S-adenosylhomocysteine deaminase